MVIAAAVSRMNCMARLTRLKVRNLWFLSPLVLILTFLAPVSFSSCEREPVLHLHRDNHINIDLPIVQLDLSVYWQYDIDYSWEAEWYYGWDSLDKDIFGDSIGYIPPSVFNIRRYFLGNNSAAPHSSVLKNQISGTSFTANYEPGWYDFLVWNEVNSLDGAQALHFDETTTLDYVTAYTNITSAAALSKSAAAMKYPNAFNQPEALFSAYKQGISITNNIEDYDYYDPVKGIYYKIIDMTLVPVTYIYLTQLIIHNNRGRVSGVTGNADLSGMARSCNVNTGVAGEDAITVHYNCRFKNNCNMKGESVDIAGGRVMTFGICNINPNRIVKAAEIRDGARHYLGIPVIFNNATDSTLVFDVTDQVRQRYKGGVITVELDMDTVPLPSRKGGSGFDAVVKDFEDGGTHEFEM